MGISFLRPSLQNICCDSPWDYAVFWKLKNHVLAWEDGFCNVQKTKISAVGKFEDSNSEEWNLFNTYGSCAPLGSPCNYPVGLAVAEMSNTSHAIGKGLVGDVVLTRNARWIYAGHINSGIFDYGLFSKYPDEWLLQFASGIKTILLLPLVPYGVLQLGSVEMVAEDTALLPQIEDVFVRDEKPLQIDWRYYVRELFLAFTSLDSSDEPEGQTASHHENHFMTEFRGFHDKSERLPAVYGILDHMISIDGGHKTFVAENNIQSFIHHEELSKATVCSEEMNWEMQGGWLEVLALPDGANGEADLFDNPIYETESNLFWFPEEYELRNKLETVKKDEINRSTEITYHSVEDKVTSFNISVPERDHVEFASNTIEMKPLIKSGVINASSSLGDSSSCITSLNTSEARNLVTPKKQNRSLKQDTWEFLTSEFAINPCFSTVSSVETKNSKLPDDQDKERTHIFSNSGKVSRLSKTNKRKDCNGDNQKPRPRDRQLIQDRIKELRELVPNSEKCSIDGLLDKTIKHMLFLRNATNQADKLKKHEATRSTEIENASWAIEFGTDQQQCPIFVKDLDLPGHMLIEMLCADHDRFLEIADVIHRLQLTVLKGVMDRSSNNSLARFTVETSGSFHRLDIFWPLMQLLQRNRAPISTNI